jgi:hypothetical protein
MEARKESGFKKLLRRRFSKEEYAELLEILKQESGKLLKRPGYVIGNLLIMVLMFFFFIRAVWPVTFSWPGIKEVVIVPISVAVGLGVVWLFLKITKLRSKVNLPGWWFIWMAFCLTCFGLITSVRESSECRWEYIMYAFAVFVGWLCVSNSIKEHLCETILKMRKSAGEGQMNIK